MKLVVNPLDTVALTGLMAILVNSAAATVRLVLPVTVMPFATLVAVMVVLPTARVVAMPLVLTVAMPVLLDVHVTLPDTLPALLSEYVPVAVKVTGNPLAMGFLEALTVMTCNLAVVTVTLTLAVLRPYAVAKTVISPAVIPLTRPFLSIVATRGLLEVQVTLLLMSAVD